MTEKDALNNLLLQALNEFDVLKEEQQILEIALEIIKHNQDEKSINRVKLLLETYITLSGARFDVLMGIDLEYEKILVPDSQPNNLNSTELKNVA